MYLKPWLELKTFGNILMMKTKCLSTIWIILYGKIERLFKSIYLSIHDLKIMNSEVRNIFKFLLFDKAHLIKSQCF